MPQVWRNTQGLARRQHIATITVGIAQQAIQKSRITRYDQGNLLSNPFKVFYFSEFLPCMIPRAACLWTSSWQVLANPSITVLRKVSQGYLLAHHLPPSNLPVLSSSCSCTRSVSCLHKSCHIHSASDFCLYPHWKTHVETRLTWN